MCTVLVNPLGKFQPVLRCSFARVNCWIHDGNGLAGPCPSRIPLGPRRRRRRRRRRFFPSSGGLGLETAAGGGLGSGGGSTDVGDDVGRGVGGTTRRRGRGSSRSAVNLNLSRLCSTYAWSTRRAAASVMSAIPTSKSTVKWSSVSPSRGFNTYDPRSAFSPPRVCRNSTRCGG